MKYLACARHEIILKDHEIFFCAKCEIKFAFCTAAYFIPELFHLPERQILLKKSQRDALGFFLEGVDTLDAHGYRK